MLQYRTRLPGLPEAIRAVSNQFWMVSGKHLIGTLFDNFVTKIRPLRCRKCWRLAGYINSSKSLRLAGYTDSSSVRAGTGPLALGRDRTLGQYSLGRDRIPVFPIYTRLRGADSTARYIYAIFYIILFVAFCILYFI